MAIIPSNDGMHIMVGDVVDLAYAFASQDQNLMGRVYGILTGRCAAQFGDYEQEFYTFLPTKNAKKFMDENFDEYFWRWDPGDKEIEVKAGTVPPGCLVVPRDRITPIYSAEASVTFTKAGYCPRCGDKGYWKALALNCPYHGMFL